MTALHHTVIELQLNIKLRDEKIASLEEEITRTNDKIKTLQDENQFTIQEKASLEGQLKQMQTMLLSKKVRGCDNGYINLQQMKYVTRKKTARRNLFS